MRKSLIFLFFLIFSTLNIAQFSKFKTNPFSNSILLTLNGGLSQSETDFNDDDLGLNINGIAEYFIPTGSDIFLGLKLELGYLNLSGKTDQLTYNSDIISLGPSGTLNYKLSDNLYPYIGLGISNLWYNQYTSIDLNTEFGIRYLISNYFAINCNLSLNFVADDKLDDLAVSGSKNDFFATLSIGLSYAVDLTVEDDIDGDGIANVNDTCPEQSEDFDGFEDEDGCPEFDNDKDGIVDIKDNCINSAEDYDGFEDNDGCPDLDNDGDGIADIDDNCPDLKEDLDNFNDLDGCPDLDNDNDGLVDANDNCPDFPETFNNYEDLDGCPDEIPETIIPEIEIPKVDTPIESITPENKIRIAIPNEFLLDGDKIFENNSARIKASANKTLNSIADQMKSNPDFSWRIEGHLDNSGNPQELKELSLKKANAIKNYFISKGLASNLFNTIGLGDEVPIAPNSTIQGKLKNRRILIKRER